MRIQNHDRLCFRIELPEDLSVSLLEELLWILPEVESVTYRIDGEDQLCSLDVITVDKTFQDNFFQLCNTHAISGAVISSVEILLEEDWAESWKKHWHVNRVLPRLVIQPSWEEFTPEPEDIVIQLDPGSAFGTGTHETTRLMLSLLEDIVKNRSAPVDSLLDIGTGSGILAIYAAKLGIPACVAMDNDPHAVDVALENTSRNGVAQQVTCITEPIDTLLPGSFEIVLANILAPILIDLMPAMKRVLDPSGKLVFGGIMKHQCSQVEDAAREEGLQVQRVVQEGGWVSIVCSKPQ